MTKTELREYVDSYKDLFTDWTKIEGEGYVRVCGPFAQPVWFENLRSGAYRPASAVSILVAKGTAMLHQFLDIRHREVLPREHKAMLPKVRTAMLEQFVPRIGLALEEQQVLAACEQNAGERLNDALAIGSLHAYFGNDSIAVKWLNVIARLTNDRSDLEDWERERLADSKALANALEMGQAKEYLESIREMETARILRK